ncbi:MAG: 16S rRNA (cytidine(1402)-2'-O)-methyltransferase [Spirochaetales bacterium]|nr:16S rRNA (cytidine(1402)-2'-O)-methyltransferase [Spirochaetales bacterium]
MSTLYVVGTPIGNLEDITIRALNTLKSVDVIACEDTRHTQKLLARYEIKNRLIACHAHNEVQSAHGIVKLLDEGNDVAYVSDAGTPGISDPGSRLVSRVRSSGYNVIPVPGVSALTALVSSAGFVGKSVLFEGFLSPKSGRRTSRLKQLLERNEAFVLYESPFRIVKVLEALNSLSPDRRLLLGREMTKSFEEFVEGPVSVVYAEFSSRDTIKGEFALLVSPEEKKEASGNDNHT